VLDAAATERLKVKWQEIVVGCTSCKGEGSVPSGPGGVKKCSCVARFGFHKRVEEARIPVKYRNATLDDYNDAVNVKPKERLTTYVKKVVEMRKAGIGLLLQGPYGTGKSYLLSALLLEAMRAGYTARFMTLEELVKAMTGSWRGALEKDIVGVDFFGLDECSKRTHVGMDLARTSLENAFRERTNLLKPMLMTSNILVDLDKLKNVEAYEGDTALFGQNLLSLFAEHVVPITFAGSDYRPTILADNRQRLREELQ
jgi:DNA replication protein DnaC